MKTAAIVLDSWKLPFFEKQLKAEGFEYTQHPGVTEDTLILKVKCESTGLLSLAVMSANNAAARSKLQ